MTKNLKQSLNQVVQSIGTDIKEIKQKLTEIAQSNDNTVREWVATYDPAQATIMDANNEKGANRRKLQLLGKFGKMHLDFTAQAEKCFFDLPADAPVPLALIEVQTHDGGTVWLGPGQRKVRSGNLTVGQRYIVDLTGFFNV